MFKRSNILNVPVMKGHSLANNVVAFILSILYFVIATVPRYSYAGHASGTAELKVVVEVKANPNLIVSGWSLNSGMVSRSGYGIHEERFGGTALFEGRTFTDNIFVNALAWSPPDSASFVAFKTNSGQFLQLANPTNVAQAVDVEFSGSLVLYAIAEDGYSTAGGGYQISAYEVGGSTVRFGDKRSIHSDDFLNASKPYTAHLMISPQDAYSLNLDYAIVTANAITAVPEPAVVAPMISGLWVVRLSSRHRKGVLNGSKAATRSRSSMLTGGQQSAHSSQPTHGSSAQR